MDQPITLRHLLVAALCIATFPLSLMYLFPRTCLAVAAGYLGLVVFMLHAMR